MSRCKHCSTAAKGPRSQPVSLCINFNNDASRAQATSAVTFPRQRQRAVGVVNCQSHLLSPVQGSSVFLLVVSHPRAVPSTRSHHNQFHQLVITTRASSSSAQHRCVQSAQHRQPCYSLKGYVTHQNRLLAHQLFKFPGTLERFLLQIFKSFKMSAVPLLEVCVLKSVYVLKYFSPQKKFDAHLRTLIPL